MMLLFSCPLVGPNMLASADERRYFIGRQYRCLEAGVLVSLRWGQNEAPGVPGGLKGWSREMDYPGQRMVSQQG